MRSNTERLGFDPRVKMHERNPHCAYCGKFIKRVKGATSDHVIPRCRGGRTIMRNLVLSCRGCNYRKADKTGWELLWWAARILLVTLRVEMEGGAR